MRKFWVFLIAATLVLAGCSSDSSETAASDAETTTTVSEPVTSEPFPEDPLLPGVEDAEAMRNAVLVALDAVDVDEAVMFEALPRCGPTDEQLGGVRLEFSGMYVPTEGWAEQVGNAWADEGVEFEADEMVMLAYSDAGWQVVMIASPEGWLSVQASGDFTVASLPGWVLEGDYFCG